MVSEVAEPDYPLEKAAFVRALATGHGRALINVVRHGAEGVRDEILDAALFPKVYDSQCNGHGEKWLARLCEIAGLVDRVISDDSGSVGLRCKMLEHFARSGHPAARPALREMCRYDEKSNDLPASCEIVDIEGEEGYLFVVERSGEALLKHPNYWVTDILEFVLDEQLGEGRAMMILDRESPGNPQIAAHREAVLAYRAGRSPKPDRTPSPVDEVIGQIATSATRIPRLLFFGEKATPEERRKVAAMDFTKMEPIPLENYLAYFQRLGFPDFREEYLSLLQHPEDRVRWRAHAVLSHHPEPQVRQAAYDALGRGKVGSFVGLLRRSGLLEDTEPLLTAIRASEILADDDAIHEVVCSLRDLVKDNGLMKDLHLPVWIYEYSPCRVCRYEAVKIMAERSILPQWIAEECLSDAYDSIREIAAKHLEVEQKF
ncbi:MAG: hypothetical protein EOP83_07520 [Verrucomicrobiaceae bacterium]|nr:MAG: hypothetical protein EOP83_07520 [Verrucomicrobiaceae bacterium]